MIVEPEDQPKPVRELEAMLCWMSEEPLRERLFIAGEATDETLWGTVGGAWESGERAAEAALRRLGVLKEPEPEVAPRKSRRRKNAVPS